MGAKSRLVAERGAWAQKEAKAWEAASQVPWNRPAPHVRSPYLRAVWLLAQLQDLDAFWQAQEKETTLCTLISFHFLSLKRYKFMCLLCI